MPGLLNSQLLSLADARMQYSERRTAVLARDIANADTPGFVARDLPSFSSLLQTLQLASASSGSSLAPARTNPDTRPEAGPMTPDGNAVDVEQALANLAGADSAQRLASELYSKYLGFYSTAAGR